MGAAGREVLYTHGRANRLVPGSNAKLRTVTGRLVADDTAFDARRLGSSWGWDDEPFAYAAQVSALTVAADPLADAGSITVETRSGAGAGGRPQVRLVPDTRYVTAVNQATTGPAGSAESISVERQHGTNTLPAPPRAAPAVDTRGRAVECSWIGAC